MDTTVLLSTPLLLFFGKIFACGLLGFFILGLLEAVVEIKLSPKGWKFGKEFFNPEDPDNIIQEDKELKVNLNPVRSDEDKYYNNKR